MRSHHVSQVKPKFRLKELLEASAHPNATFSTLAQLHQPALPPKLNAHSKIPPLTRNSALSSANLVILLLVTQPPE